MLHVKAVSDTFGRVEKLTAIHVDKLGRHEKSTLWKLYSSLVEEVGEVAAALKIEGGVVKHKQLNESANDEMVDVAISAAMMYFALGGESKHIGITNFVDEEFHVSEISKLYENPFEAVGYISTATSSIACMMGVGFHAEARRFAMDLVGEALNFCVVRGLSAETFITKMNTKLDKWERNQAEYA